jgi:16S rRNA (adenine1518-N6/adenine1519-N6)-dimethyltransferase
LIKLNSTEDKYLKYKPKKFLGQNFLVDDNIARKIIKSLDTGKNEKVIEIGPGHGSLTKFLINETGNLTVVEFDRGFAEKLKNEYAEKIKVIHKDFLKIDFKDDLAADNNSLKIIGNIPYNITTEILFKLFDNSRYIISAVIMMQKEVARRLSAGPGSKDYGILAVQTQAFSNPKILFNVPRTVFFPKPGVDSSVVKLELNKAAHGIGNVTLFKELVRSAFGKRRKKLGNSLKDFFVNKNINPEDLDIDLSKRAEELNVEDFIILANDINKMITNNSTGKNAE